LSGKGRGECRIYCSEECKEACPTYRKRLHQEGQNTGSSTEVSPVFRQMVLERDKWTCQKCEAHKDELYVPLHVHHIVPKKISPVEQNDVENGITLCQDCHESVHKLDGCGYHYLANCMAT